jgi:hypothetical protein
MLCAVSGFRFLKVFGASRPKEIHMSHSPSDARLKLTPEEEAKLITMDHNEMIGYLHQLELDKGLVVPDILNESVRHEITPVETKQADEIKQMTIDGVVVRGTQAELDGFMRAAFVKAQQQQDDAPARDTNGRFVKTADQGKNDEAEALKAAAAADLTLKFQRGEIPPSEYLKQSGAMDEYLASKGIDVNAHQKQLQDGQKYEQSWAQATADFKQTEDGKHAPYGPGFAEVIGEKLIELGLDDSPSVASLQKAYNALAIEAEMSKENDPAKMEDLRERYRQEVMGRRTTPRYNQ